MHWWQFNIEDKDREAIMKLLRIILLAAFTITACTTSPQAPPVVPTNTPTLAPTQAPTLTPTPTIVPTPVPAGGGGTLFFYVGKALYPKEMASDKPSAWFSAASDGSGVAPASYDVIYDVAPAGDRMIVFTGGELDLVKPDGTGKVKLDTGSDNNIPFSNITWLSDGGMVFGAVPPDKGGKGSIYVGSADGTKVTRLQKPAEVMGETLAVLFADADESGVYWVTGTKCNERGICQEKYFYTKLDDSDQQQVWQNMQSAGLMIYPSVSRKFMTYFQYFGWSIKNGCALGMMSGQPISAVGLGLSSYCGPEAWSPTEEKLLVEGYQREKDAWQQYFALWDEPGNRVTQLPAFNAAACWTSQWTPDGKAIFLSGCIDQYKANVKRNYVGSRLIQIADGTVTEYPDVNDCSAAISPDSNWALLYACQTADRKPAPSQLLDLRTKEVRPILEDFVSHDAKTLQSAWWVHWAAPAGAAVASANPSAAATPQAGTAETPAAGTGRIWSQTNMVQVYVPAGEFTMGSDAEGAQPNAKPAHQVALDAFWIDQTEVTNRMYLACITAGVCTPPEQGPNKTGKGKGDIGSGWKRQSVEGALLAQAYDLPEAADLPVIDVSWDQAKQYCAWAGETLPTEAQWEKAARGTDGRMFPWGDAIPTRYLVNNYYGQPVQVGSYPAGASPYGTLDQAGNVWEFVADWYGRDYYASSPQQNPTGPDEGFAHVIRGSSYAAVDAAGWMIATFSRYYEGAPGNTSHVGFRCVSAP